VGRNGAGPFASLLVYRACHGIRRLRGTDSMGAGFVWLDRSKCGSEHIGREEEGVSSGRVEMGAYAAILRRTPDHEDLIT
jgi:hypothetical protein